MHAVLKDIIDHKFREVEAARDAVPVEVLKAVSYTHLTLPTNREV